MRMRVSGLLAGLCVLAACAGLWPIGSWAAVAIQTERVSGIIVAKAADQTIRLDNGQTYQPARPELAPGVPVGQPITLRDYVEGGERNVFFEYAPGVNSLKEIPPTATQEDSGPN